MAKKIAELVYLQECPLEDVKNEATRLLNQTLPILLRFMADEYDDTCSTIFPFLQTVLGSVCFLSTLLTLGSYSTLATVQARQEIVIRTPRRDTTIILDPAIRRHTAEAKMGGRSGPRR